MFNLESREKFIILFLIAVLIIGLSVMLYQKSSSVIDVKIRGFNYEGVVKEPLKININEADELTLMRLPGIGKSLAGRIMEYRDKKGRFRSIEELKKVKGIGDKLYGRIKDEACVE